MVAVEHFCILSGPWYLEDFILSIAFDILFNVTVMVISSCINCLFAKSGSGSYSSFPKMLAKHYAFSKILINDSPILSLVLSFDRTYPHKSLLFVLIFAARSFL